MLSSGESEADVAEQLEFFPVPSPCRGICQTDARGYCRGCLRSREERFNWMRFSDAQKREVLRLCRQRYLRLQRQQKPDAGQDPQQPSLF
ncbi:DUF1289 domain-containing protein [Pantoea sp. SIMBA_079]|jgi:predicted Fe-S protein YdhL (DUF1289 family)|uniref:DUF1289 domain-containing protein n=1 Tax=Pantoea TaxID=53335 RepID=UPI0009464148|nr:MULTISPECIES: DUF1289 domain-containing protein [Pantoea]